MCKGLETCVRASGVGKTTMGGGSLDSIASQIRNAVSGWGTNEDAIKSALSKVQTIPDLCAVSQDTQKIIQDQLC